MLLSQDHLETGHKAETTLQATSPTRSSRKISNPEIHSEKVAGGVRPANSSDLMANKYYLATHQPQSLTKATLRQR